MYWNMLLKVAAPGDSIQGYDTFFALIDLSSKFLTYLLKSFTAGHGKTRIMGDIFIYFVIAHLYVPCFLHAVYVPHKRFYSVYML